MMRVAWRVWSGPGVSVPASRFNSESRAAANSCGNGEGLTSKIPALMMRSPGTTLKIFTSATPSVPFFHNVRSCVSEEMNTRLLRPFTAEEVKLALFDMALEKSPGLDGMTFTFYQRFWSVVGHDLSCFVLNCLHTRILPHCPNSEKEGA
nr:uncharacterized protein LOC109181252 [Ipomoea batatas]